MKEKKRVQKNHKSKIIVATAVICFLLFFSIVFSLMNITNSKILPNIEVMDINVGKQEKAEAEKNLLDVVEKRLQEISCYDIKIMKQRLIHLNLKPK